LLCLISVTHIQNIELGFTRNICIEYFMSETFADFNLSAKLSTREMFQNMLSANVYSCFQISKKKTKNPKNESFLS